MSYYFPFGGSAAASVQSIPYALSAITASVPENSTTITLTASFASTVQITPLAGTNGANKTLEDCGTSDRVGPQGVQGPTGSKGPDNTTCPPGTVECVSLNQYLPNLNSLRPSGSQFSKVCMQIPIGCNSGNAVCPPYLPSASVNASYPNIP
jgi:hypothetical protein